MRNRLLAMLMAVGFTVFPFCLRAQTPAATAGSKVGVIDIQQAILETAEGKQAFQDLQKKYQPREEEINQREQDVQSSFQYDRDTLMRDLGKKMMKVIDQYASTHGYALVIDGSQVPVYYAAQGVDITQDIVKLYNSTYPVQAASASTDSSGGTSQSQPASPQKTTPKQ